MGSIEITYSGRTIELKNRVEEILQRKKNGIYEIVVEKHGG